MLRIWLRLWRVCGGVAGVWGGRGVGATGVWGGWQRCVGMGDGRGVCGWGMAEVWGLQECVGWGFGGYRGVWEVAGLGVTLEQTLLSGI